jgi:hypothetical protein
MKLANVDLSGVQLPLWLIAMLQAEAQGYDGLAILCGVNALIAGILALIRAWKQE